MGKISRQIVQTPKMIAIIICAMFLQGYAGNGIAISVRSVDAEVDADRQSGVRVVAIATGWDNTVALYEDGVVRSTDGFDSREENNSSLGQNKWEDIVAIDSGWSRIIGLRKDGTVVSDDYRVQVKEWSEIRSICTTQGTSNNIIGIKNDGTLISTILSKEFARIESWKDIVQVCSADTIVIGLKSDGTLVQAGSKSYPIDSWRNIKQISLGSSGLVGLSVDGRVFSTDYHNDVSAWRDIVKISSGGQIVGLKNDGSVISTAFSGKHMYEQLGHDLSAIYQISEWKDIIDVSSGPFHIAGLKSDGVVVATGYKDNGQTFVEMLNDRDADLTLMRLDSILLP